MSARTIAVALLAAALLACDKLPTAQKEPAGSLGEVARTAIGFMTPGALEKDIVFDEFLSDLGLQKVYGARASEIEDQLRKSRLAAARQISQGSSGGRLARVSAALGVFIVPYFAQALASYLDVMTKPGARTHQDPPMSQTTTEAGATSTSVTTLRISQTAGGEQGRVTLTVTWAYHTTTKDNASGAVLVETDDTRTIVGGITVCPDEQGQVNAAVSVKAEFRGVAGGSTTTRGTTSDTVFTGHVSDAASLTNVHQTTQDTEEWSSPSGDGRVEAVISSTAATNASGEMGTPDASSYTGTLNASGSESQRGARFAGWTMALDAAAIQPSYKEAQRLFRGGRCVVVVVPDFNNAETPIEVGEQEKPQHDEEVDPDSETEFAVRLKYRFNGGELRLPLKAQLTSGKERLQPDQLPSGSGSLKYRAPNEEDKKATALLRSTSKRGIGTLVLDFHTGKPALTLTVTGTMRATTNMFGVSSESTDTVTVGPVEFKKAYENVFEGTGTWQAQHSERTTGFGRTINCSMNQSGKINWRAERVERGDKKVVWVIEGLDADVEGNSTMTCEGATTDIGTSADLFLGILGQIVIPEEGGRVPVSGSAVSDRGPTTATGTATGVTGKK